MLGFCYMVPLVCRYVGEGLGIPIAPLAPMALLALTIAHSLRAQPLGLMSESYLGRLCRPLLSTKAS